MSVKERENGELVAALLHLFYIVYLFRDFNHDGTFVSIFQGYIYL